MTAPTSRNANTPLRARCTTAGPAVVRPGRPARQDGYALVGLLALMTILALALAAAAPSLRQQTRRDLEREAIARGEEVAEAIALYTRAKGAPPTEMQQLLDGVSVGIKKIQILRPSAARDPLSAKGEWKLVHPGDKVLTEFQDGVAKYAGVPVAALPPSRDRFFDQFRINIQGLTNLKKEPEQSGCDEDTEPNVSSGPFIGVVSRNRCASVITYYGLERHDRWVFTPLFR